MDNLFTIIWKFMKKSTECREEKNWYLEQTNIHLPKTKEKKSGKNVKLQKKNGYNNRSQ